MAAFIPFRTESPMTATHCCFFIALVLILHLLEGLVWSNLEMRTCMAASSSIHSHSLPAASRASYLFINGSWMSSQRLLSQLHIVTVFHYVVSLKLLPLSWCRSDTRPASVLSMLGWHVCTREGRAWLCWSITFLDFQMVLNLPSSSWTNSFYQHILQIYTSASSQVVMLGTSQSLRGGWSHNLHGALFVWLRNRSRACVFLPSGYQVCASSLSHTKNVV